MSLLDSRLAPLEDVQEEENLTNEKLAEELKKLKKDTKNKVESKKKKNKKDE